VAMPIFVARQWIRHRTANVNEYSGRYSIMPDRFYRPSRESIRRQGVSNRQGGDERFDLSDEAAARTADEFLKYLDRAEALYRDYLALTDQGVSRELARIGLGVNLYTEWYWKCDLHNLLHFLSLRMDRHAQEEIQVYARAIHALIAPIVPVTIEAWHDYVFDAVRLSRLEVEALRDLARGGPGILKSENARERGEWDRKRAELGWPPPRTP
jgi:thymidylate synthase (FAD)